MSLTKPIKIGNTEFDPSKMDIGVQTVSGADAGRDQSGLMHLCYVTTKFKIELEWLCPSPALTRQILAAVQPTAANQGTISVTFVNPVTNAEETRNFYVGDRSAPYQMWGTSRKFFSRLAFNLIEL